MLILHKGVFVHTFFGDLISKNDCFKMLSKSYNLFPGSMFITVVPEILKQRKIVDMVTSFQAAVQLILYGKEYDKFALDYATALLFLLYEDYPQKVVAILNTKNIIDVIANDLFPGGQKSIFDKIYGQPKDLTHHDLQQIFSIYKARMVNFLALGLNPSNDYVTHLVTYQYLQIDIHLLDGGIPSKLFLEFVAAMNTLIFDTFTGYGISKGYSIIDSQGQRKKIFECTLESKGKIDTMAFSSPCKCPCEGCTMFAYIASSFQDLDSTFPSEKVLDPILLEKSVYEKRCIYNIL